MDQHEIDHWEARKDLTWCLLHNNVHHDPTEGRGAAVCAVLSLILMGLGAVYMLGHVVAWGMR